jgi:hypothetical protein
MLISRIRNKVFFLIENYIFFFKNFFKRDLFFAKVFYQINISLRKTDWIDLKSELAKIYKSGVLKNIEYKLFYNKNVVNLKDYYYPEIYLLYLYYRFFKNFSDTFNIKIILLKNNFLKKKNFLFTKNFELQNYDKNEIEVLFKNNLNKKLNSNQDKKFKIYLKGKKIALVGPKFSVKSLGDEIDTYDVVIRTNYRKNSNLPFSVYGSKTNISYYNSYRVANSKEDIIKNQTELDWMIFKSQNDIRKLDLDFSQIDTRVSINPSNFFLFSSPMSPQRIIYDILSYHPKVLKIFHFDFYNSGSYNKNYKHWDLSYKKISNNLREHGAFSCFIFMKNFYEMNYFLADTETENVLKQDIKQYANNLDKNFGDLI